MRDPRVKQKGGAALRASLRVLIIMAMFTCVECSGRSGESHPLDSDSLAVNDCTAFGGSSKLEVSLAADPGKVHE